MENTSNVQCIHRLTKVHLTVRQTYYDATVIFFCFLVYALKPEDRNPIRENVLAHLISMTVQLKYFAVEQFEWILHAVQYVRLCFIF